MQYRSSFKITGWEPAEADETDEIADIARARIRKAFTGDLEGTSVANAILYQTLVKSGGYAALERITPAIAHDLRGAINTLTFQVEILRGAAGNDPLRREKALNVFGAELERLHQQIERLVGMVSPRPLADALDLRREVTDLAELLTAYGRRRRVTIERDLPETSVSLRGAIAPIRRALLALGMAAVDHAPMAGAIHLRVEGGREPQVLVTVDDSEAALDLPSLRDLFTAANGQPIHGPNGSLGVQFAPSSND